HRPLLGVEGHDPVHLAGRVATAPGQPGPNSIEIGAEAADVEHPQTVAVPPLSPEAVDQPPTDRPLRFPGRADLRWIARDRPAGSGRVRQVASLASRVMAAVEVDGLEVRYGNVVAVAGISFSAEAGRITAVLGPNGAGKTSTIE